MKRHYLAGALVALLLVGCQESPSAPESNTNPALNIFVHMSTPYAFTEEGMPLEVREADQMPILLYYEKISLIHAEAADWKEAHENIQRELATSSEAPQYLREQYAAAYMLQTHLVGEDVTEEQLDAIGYYTDLLVKHRSPEGTLIVESLQRLEGHWPEDKIASAALRATEGVEVFLSKRLDCDDCASKTLDRMGKNTNTPILAQENSFLYQLSSALEDLRAMSTQ